MFVEAYETLEVETQEVLLTTLLETTTTLLRENTSNAALAENLASVMIDVGVALLFVLMCLDCAFHLDSYENQNRISLGGPSRGNIWPLSFFGARYSNQGNLGLNIVMLAYATHS